MNGVFLSVENKKYFINTMFAKIPICFFSPKFCTFALSYGLAIICIFTKLHWSVSYDFISSNFTVW